MRTTYRIGGWFGRYLWVSIPGGFVAAGVLSAALEDVALTVIVFVAAVTNAVSDLVLLSIRTLVDQEGIEQRSLRRGQRTAWHDVVRGVLTTVEDDRKAQVTALELRDGSQTPFGKSLVGRRPDGGREALVERMRRELDERGIPRDW